MAPSATTAPLDQLAGFGNRTAAASGLRVLALQLKRVGDLVLTTPALWAIRQQYPAVHLTLATTEASASLVPAMNYVDQAVIFRRGMAGCRAWGQLAGAPFDVCLDFTGTDRSALASLASKARRRISFRWVRKSSWRPLAYTRLVDSPVREAHTIDHYLDLLQPLEIEAQGLPVMLHLPPDAFRKAKELLAAAGVTEPFAIVHPGSARAEKYWLPERWAEVITVLQERLPVVLTGGNDPAEQEHLRRLKAALPRPVADLSGRLDLLGLAALVHQAQLFLSVDTGPMHLAAAFHTRQIALFGKTNPFHWRPRHAKAWILLSGHDEPITEFTPHLQGGEMARISTTQVIRAMEATRTA